MNKSFLKFTMTDNKRKFSLNIDEFRKILAVFSFCQRSTVQLKKASSIV